ncbi:response regulator [Myxosarcina sp. GI1(2024)]
MDKDITTLTSSLIPYVRQGLLDLIEVEDINLPKYTAKFCPTDITKSSSTPLIACIDDSPQICKIMEEIITKCDYRFISIQESFQVLPTLIKTVPSLIFMDIGMPVINGYELCSQLRRVSKLKDVPIVILTGNDGIIDRVRAKVVGADDFISKPIETSKIIDALKKYISLSSLSSDSVLTNKVNSVAE